MVPRRVYTARRPWLNLNDKATVDHRGSVYFNALAKLAAKLQSQQTSPGSYEFARSPWRGSTRTL